LFWKKKKLDFPTQTLRYDEYYVVNLKDTAQLEHTFQFLGYRFKKKTFQVA